METIWTPHRFSGEALALDVANTVVLRVDPARRFDRFDDPTEITRFAEAATGFRADEIGGARLAVTDPPSSRSRLIALREATDALFRDSANNRADLRADLLVPFMRRCADGLSGSGVALASSGALRPDASGRVELEAAVAASALALLAPGLRDRIRICGNCGWLYLDRSRNRSRKWCDMTVCGNRQKARRHYRRRREGESAADA